MLCLEKERGLSLVKNYRKWLSILLTIFFLSSLLSFLCIRVLQIPSSFLPLFSGTLLVAVSMFNKREGAFLRFLPRKPLQETDSVVRFLRHELMNHLQIIYCLAQLGKKRRLEQAVNCLGEKTQSFKEIVRLESPKLISAAGGLLFSVPAEIPMTLEIAPTFSVPASLDSDAITIIDSLQSYLRSSSYSKSVALNFTSKEVNRSFLDVNIIYPSSYYTYGELRTYLKEEKVISDSNIAIGEKRIDGEFFVKCSIAFG